jgi:hypothetical protein
MPSAFLLLMVFKPSLEPRRPLIAKARPQSQQTVRETICNFKKR